MKIYSGNTLVLDIEVDDDSYRYRAVKGENTLVLKFSLAQHVEIPTGSYCDFQNERYTLKRPENLKMNHTRSFDYALEMHAAQYNLASYKLRNTVDKRLKFSYTAQPQEHLQMLVDNLNARETGWSVGECIAGTEKVISYNHTYLHDALNQIADTFETEWEISGKTISLRKVEYNRDNPLALSYGRDYDEDGNAGGFKPGLGRTNFEDSMPVEILYVQGGSRNIDASKYGSADLLLPKGATLRYDGAHFEDEAGFDQSRARIYGTDEYGYSMRRQDKQLKTQQEDSLDCTEVYPHRDEKILKVIAVNPEKNWYDVVTDTPESLNYREYGIGGETPTIIFQSGMLAGREFDLESDDTGIICEKYYDNGEFIGWKFQIVPAEIDGITMPGGNYLPAVNDVFRVFGIQLPDAYIEEDETKTGASWEMFREGIRYFYEHEDERFTFTGTLDGIWAKQDWLNIGGKIRLGGFISFRNTQFQPEPVLIRITGIKDYVNNPYSPEIELSNGTKGMSVSSELNQIASNEAKAESQYRDSVNFTKRRFRDAQETIAMLEDALLAGFDDSISPLTVQTMMMLVGDQSLQFRFVDSETNPQQVVHNVEYNSNKILTVDAGIIQHMTLNIKSVSTGHNASEYKFWTLPEFNSPVLVEPEKKYYLYAKVSRTAGTGVFYLSETAKSMESESGYYYLLMGILNSEFDGERSYVSLYGFTEVLPGQITTDVIRDTEGNLIIDLANKLITAKNGARIDGNLTIGPSSSGLENLTEWAGKQEQINDAQESANAAQETASDASQQAAEAQDTADQKRRTFVSTPYTPYDVGDLWVQGSAGDIMRCVKARQTGNYVASDWDKASMYTDDTKANEALEAAKSAIVGTDVMYYLSDSPVELTGGEWSTTAPQWQQGKYIWTKTTVEYGSGEQGESDPVCITGNDGKGISSITEWYYLSDSPIELTGGEWSTTAPQWQQGKYIWTKSIIQYADATQSETTPICVTGPSGEDGSPGQSVLAQYSADGTAWHSTYNDGDVWMRTSADGGTNWTPAIRIVGQDGADGKPGEDGAPGKDGKTYYTWIRYADDENGNGISNDPTGKNYIGFAYNKETPSESSDPKDYKWSDIKGEDGAPGQPGPDGKTLYTWIAYSDNASGSPMYQQPKDSTQYIGIATNKETSTESTDPGDYTWSKFKGDKGDKGDQGIQGIPGADGADGADGIDGAPGKDGSYVTVQFAKNTSTILSPTSGWQSEPPTTQAGEYVWMRQGTVQPPATSPTSWGSAVRITGDTGAAGQDVYILDLSNEVATVSCDVDGNVTSALPICVASVYKGGSKDFRYQFAAEFTGCTGSIRATTGIISFDEITSNTAEVVVTASCSVEGTPTLTSTMTITKVYPGKPGNDGLPGDDGKNSVMRYLLPSADKIVRSFTGALSPDSITCAKMKQSGDSEAETDTDPDVVIKYQRLGEDTTEKTYSGEISITDETTAVVLSLYEGTTLIDRERIPVLNDATGMEPPSGNLLQLSSFNTLDGLISPDSSCVVEKASSLYEENGNTSVKVTVLRELNTSEATHTVSSTTVYYMRKTINEVPSSASGSWSTTRPSLSQVYSYLFAYVLVTYSDSSTGKSNAVLVAQYSSETLLSLTPYYHVGDSETVDRLAGEWTTSRPQVSSSNPYLHVSFRAGYASGDPVDSEVLLIACYDVAGLDLLMWPSAMTVDVNLMLSLYLQGVQNETVYVKLDGAETEKQTAAGGWLQITGFKSYSLNRFTVDFGKVTSAGSSPRIRLRFSAAGTYYINSPMLTYGNVQGAWTPAVQDAEYAVSDLQYLKETFGYVLDVNGVVLGKLVAVKDEVGNVRAMLNGSDLGKDSTKGKLLIAAGMDGIQDPTAAKTKIYEDGTIDTELLKARAGDIGGLSIEDGIGISDHDTRTLDGDEYEDFVRLTYGGIQASRRITGSLNRTMKIVGIPCTTMNMGDGEGTFPDINNREFVFALSSIERSTSTTKAKNVTLLLEAKGHANPARNIAINSLSGLYAGLRPMLKKMTSTTLTLTKEDYAVTVSGSGSHTITLPSLANSEHGQRYEVFKDINTPLTIKSTSTNIWHMGFDLNASLSFDSTKSCHIFMIYSEDDERWCLQRYYQ